VIAGVGPVSISEISLSRSGISAVWVATAPESWLMRLERGSVGTPAGGAESDDPASGNPAVAVTAGLGSAPG
jgi:hypothetical protein